MLATASLTIGVAAVVVLVAVQSVFQGLVVGSLLGNAVTVQVRGPDVAALAAVVLLAAAGVADVLYLSVREQAAEFAALRATGWTERALSALVLIQGLILGVLGGMVGAVVGCVAVAVFVGTLEVSLIAPTVVGAGVGVVVAALAALIPALLIRRLPTAALLSQEG